MKTAFLADACKNLSAKRWRGIPDGAAVYSLARGLNANKIPAPLWIVTPTEQEAEKLVLGFQFWLKNLPVFLYPQDDPRTFDGASGAPNVIQQRIVAMDAIYQNRQCVVVSSAFGSLHRCLSQQDFQSLCLSIAVNQQINPEELREHLQKQGYLFSSILDEQGLFFWRGDTLRIWPIGHPNPVRISFFDDEIEAIQEITTGDFIPVSSRKNLSILPAREAVVNQTALQKAARHMSQMIQQNCGTLQTRRRTLQELSAGLWFPGAEDYLPALWDLHSPLATAKHHIFFRPEAIEHEWQQWQQKIVSRWDHLSTDDLPCVDRSLRYTNIDELQRNLHAGLSIDGLTGDIDFQVISGEQLRAKSDDLTPLIAQLNTWLLDAWNILICCPTQNKREFLLSLLKNAKIQAQKVSAVEELVRGKVCLISGVLPAGFIDNQAQFACLSAQQLFAVDNKPPTRVGKSLREASLASYTELKVGDYVVHRVHGIGKFLRMTRILVDGIDRECVELAYQGEAKLFIPINKMHQLHRYRAAGSIQPRLDKLGGASWQKRIKKVREKTMAMAQELLRRQAQRASVEGYCYTKQNEKMLAFSASFPYEETPDQEAAIIDVLADLAKDKPMNRLLIGDVGFGKTEVAMRAAMRVVMEGHQVAILCPTTVLAMQHHRTFTERFSPFKKQVRLISRLQTSAQARKIKNQLLTGEVDILIGTHALLNRTIHFKRLGLVIADEEHRFGVKQKEKLKAMSQTSAEIPAEFLAMSATPIPRTLHMALSGIRDVSIIATPPPGRRPVQTMTLRRSDSKVQKQIRRELQRGGQVFFVHNRVQSLALVAKKLQDLLPEAKIRIAHGQMDKKQLESTMIDFMQHKIHILVCTSIIENGIDLPNVNTIIIDNAHLLGMAQLYQLRGRVGRSKIKAYCSFLIPNAGVQREALMRINTLQRFTDLGSGFAVASSDLELRGSGNLLGKEQSGHIQAVGLETYIELLEESIARLNKDFQRIKLEPEIQIPVPALLPEEYIPETQERLLQYKKLSMARTITEIRDLIDEWEKSYGEPPTEALHLGWLNESRLWCRELGLAKLHWLKSRVRIISHSSSSIAPEPLQALAKKYKSRMNVKMINAELWELSVSFLEEEAHTPFHFLLWIFKQLKRLTITH